MSTKYIVGRPLQLNGEKFEIGDELSAKDIQSIPRLESFINGRFIFQVFSAADAKKLPNFVIAKMHDAKAAKAKYTKNGTEQVGPRPDLDEIQEAHLASRQVQIAERDAKIQDYIYAVNRGETVELPEGVAVPEETEETEEASEEVTEVTTEPTEPLEPFDPPATQEELEENEEVNEPSEPEGLPEDSPEVEEAPVEEAPVEEAPEEEVVVEETPDPNAEFDPFEHSVAEVKDYIAENPDDEERVLLKEIDGKGRKGLVGE